jgi:hypothetical protein
VRFCKGVVEFDGFAGGGVRFGRDFAGRTLVIDWAKDISSGQAGPGGSVIGLKLNGLLEIFDAVLGIALVPEVKPAEIGVVRLGIDVARRRSGRGGGFYFLGNSLGKFFGERVGLVEIAVVALGPDVGICGSVDELHGHVDPIGGALDGAFEDAIDSEFAGDVADGALHAFVLHGGRTGDYSEVAVFG